MCGIVGYIGKKQASPILLGGLERLEYRGYDSAGLAVKKDGAETVIVKAKGRLRALAEKTDDGASVKGCCGIGHTRWATHGEPSETNAHPHCSDDKRVIAVHNGIIENYKPLKEKLEKAGSRLKYFSISSSIRLGFSGLATVVSGAAVVVSEACVASVVSG